MHTNYIHNEGLYKNKKKLPQQKNVPMLCSLHYAINFVMLYI